MDETMEDTNLNESSPATEVAMPSRKYSNIQQGELSRVNSEVNLLQERKVDLPTTNTETLMHLLKGNIGTGILAIPDALKNSGLATGTAGLVIISVFCVHCMHLLLRTAKILYNRLGMTELSYPEVAEYAFKTGPVRLRKYSTFARVMTSTFICITQLGFCCVYILFTANNFQIAFNWMGDYKLSIHQYMWMILPFLISVNFVRDLKYLAIASTLANVLQIGSLGVVFYYICQDLPSASSRPQFASFSTLPLWFGTAIFSFEGIGLVLPLENNMKTPEALRGKTGVLNTAMVIVTCFYTGVGFFGYLKYGEKVLGSITFNLPPQTLAQLAKIAYGLAIFLSYPVQFYVPINAIWPPIKDCIPYSRYHLVLELAFRVTVIMITFVLAYIIPHLGLFISLVGALSGSFVSLILPPLLHTVTRWNEGIGAGVVAKDIFIFLLGLLGFFTGTYASIMSLADAFSKDST